MQTLKHNKDLFLQTFPINPKEWAENPVITFNMPVEKTIIKGDRIFCAIKMIKDGSNSGTIREIFYYINEIQEVKPNENCAELNITATATRREI